MPYTPIINFILTNPDANGLRVGQSIVDAFFDYYKAKPDDTASPYLTMSVYDLSKTDSVCYELNNLSKVLFDSLQISQFRDTAVNIFVQQSSLHLES